MINCGVRVVFEQRRGLSGGRRRNRLRGGLFDAEYAEQHEDREQRQAKHEISERLADMPLLIRVLGVHLIQPC